MTRSNSSINKKSDAPLILVCLSLALIGLLSIFAAQHREGENIIQHLLSRDTDYAKQFVWVGLCFFLAIVVTYTDSKLFVATANLQYAFGILLLLLTFVVGKNINGSKSWIPLGFMNIQPAEICKIFTSLAIAKFFSLVDTDFTKTKSQLTAAAICLLPAALTILENETGLALVYFSFFLVMYREGLPSFILIIGVYLAALVIASLLMEPNTLAIVLTIFAVIAIYIYKKTIKKDRLYLFLILGVWLFSVGIQRFAVPYIFNHVLKPYQVDRIMSLVGKEYVPQNAAAATELKSQQKNKKKANQSEYNVKQSKIAIGSGGFIGKGYLKGTQTSGKFVPAQSTDFIFCTIGESFGFLGSFVFIGLYLFLLLRILYIAERQRSTFSRVYAYSVASILFFHVTINIGMTIGLMPVIGIPLPFISYGGSSIITFTILVFILIRLDMDRGIILR